MQCAQGRHSGEGAAARLQGADRQSKTRQDSPLTKDRRTLYSVGTAMGRFETTARTYAARREPYPAEFFAAAADALKLRGDESLIDLGTGPGLLATALRAMSATSWASIRSRRWQLRRD